MSLLFLTSLIFMLLFVCSFASNSEATDISEIYSPKNELRCLGATQQRGPFPGMDVFMKPIRECGYNTVIVSGLDDG